MNNAKGTEVVTLRKFIQDLNKENDFISKLSPEDAKYYRTALAVSKVPIEMVGRLYTTAGPLLYPNDPQPYVKLGHAIMKSDLNGIYKFLLRFFTVQHIVKQAATIFSTYHDMGSARTVYSPNKPNYLECYFEDHLMPPIYKQTLEGTIIAVMETAGCKMINVVTDFTNPKSWQYVITWK